MESKKNVNYEVYEDNGGGLHLFILSANGNPVDYFSRFEYQGKDALKNAIADIANYKQWDNDYKTASRTYDWYNGKKLKDIYEELSENEWVNLIAQNGEIYPERMGADGQIAFGIEKED